MVFLYSGNWYAANFKVGSACKGMPMRILFKYTAAILGCSSACLDSSCAMEAKVITSFSVKPKAFALAFLLSFQNRWYSFIILSLNSMADVFQKNSSLFAIYIPKEAAFEKELLVRNCSSFRI